MLDLKRLQDVGALPKKLNIVPLSEITQEAVISYSKIKQADAEFRSTCEKAIVVDDYQWIAISDDESIDSAKIVYSCDGKEHVGTFNTERSIFFQKELRGNMLYTVDQIKINKEEKEKQVMADVSLDKLDFTGIEGVVPQAEVTPQAIAEDGDKKISESQQKIKEIIEKVDQVGAEVANRDDLTLFNQKYGRLLAFITRTDKGIKVTKTKVNKVDAQGNPVLSRNLSADQLKKVEDSKTNPDIKIPSSYYEKDTAMVFKESKPSAPIGVIVATPKGGYVDYTKMGGNEKLMADKDTALEVKIMGMEVFYTFLAAYYDGRIKESEDTVGARATWLVERFTRAAQSKDAPEATMGIRTSIALEDRKARGSVLTTGNYIPLKKYVTMSQSQIKTAEDAAKLQLNVEAAFKKEGSYDALRDADKKIIGENGVTSEYFKQSGSKPITGVTKFDDKNAEVADIQIPIRTKKESKNTAGSYTYGYVFENLEDNGALFAADKSVANILKVAGMDTKSFLDEVSKIATRKSASGKKYMITPETFIKAQLSNMNANSKLSTKEIAAQLAGMQR